MTHWLSKQEMQLDDEMPKESLAESGQSPEVEEGGWRVNNPLPQQGCAQVRALIQFPGAAGQITSALCCVTLSLGADTARPFTLSCPVLRRFTGLFPYP